MRKKTMSPGEITIGTLGVGRRSQFLVIAGPCVIENEEVVSRVAVAMKELCAKNDFSFVFKSSYDKANRTSLSSYRGPGIEKGLRVLSDVREKTGVPVLTDVHSTEEAREAAKVVDVLQIPAFLCRQTDLIVAASNTGKPVNIKKGQFLSPWDVRNIIEKFISTGNANLSITERGSSFGYNNLVVDFRSFPVMRSFGYPVIFDVTHSLQLPGGMGESSGGQRQFARTLARAAVAAGIDGLFMEVHPEPDKALCDGPNMVPLDEVGKLLAECRAIREVSRVS
jgi:2-dehydro-3-deoxyphosphooctonate aldolase (KDO 8-P synthase)